MIDRNSMIAELLELGVYEYHDLAALNDDDLWEVYYINFLSGMDDI